MFGLLAAILLVGNVSGGHFNPAVSTMFFMEGGLNMQDLMFYVGSQLAGAYVATQFVKLQ
jgi:aquaporin Z